MKKFFRPAFCLALTVVFITGAMLTLAPEAEALGGNDCPLCYVPVGAPGWTLYDSCNDFTNPHCPLFYRLYRNDYTGQMCRGQFAVANI